MSSKFFNVGVLFVASLVAIKFIVYLLSTKSSKRLPPVVRAWPPVIGNLIQFSKGPDIMLREQYEKLGSVFSLKLLHKSIIFLVGPEVSGCFFNAPESDVSQREMYSFTVPIFGNGVFFDVDNAVRQEQFGFFSEALRAGKLHGLIDQMVDEAQGFFSKWGECGEVDLKEEMERLIILTVSRTVLGKEVRDKLMDDVSTLFDDLGRGMHPIGVLFPYAPIPAHRRRDRARRKLDEIFSNIIASRQATGRSENDVLQYLIDSKYKDGRSTTTKEVIGLLVGAVFGGQQTTSMTSTWVGACLLHYKEYLSVVLEEQKCLMKKHGEKINYDVLSQMDVLNRCIKETLRLHSPIELLLRQSHSDFSVTTRDGKIFDIPKGSTIATSIAITNHLPYIYKDPDNYNPDRFALGREEDKPLGKLSYLSFGGGKHFCKGDQFANGELLAIWSYLLRNFELELISPFPQADRSGLIVGIKGKVMVRYKRRTLS